MDDRANDQQQCDPSDRPHAFGAAGAAEPHVHREHSGGGHQAKCDDVEAAFKEDLKHVGADNRAARGRHRRKAEPSAPISSAGTV